jgi:hypothetical protein
MRFKTLLLSLLSASFTLLLSNCHKSTNVKPAQLSYTSKMGGTRNWTGSYFYQASGVHFPTPINEFYYHPDTSFALIIVNDSSVQLGNNTFQYEQTDETQDIYFFGTAYFYYQYGSGEGLAYYYDKDSIVFCHGDVHGTSDFWTLKDLYYTY